MDYDQGQRNTVVDVWLSLSQVSAAQRSFSFINNLIIIRTNTAVSVVVESGHGLASS